MDYSKVADSASVDQTAEALVKNGFIVEVVADKAAALEALKKSLPAGVTLSSGASQTLEQIGFIDLLKSGQHAWHNLKDAIATETDPAKQAALRQQATLADYFLGSVHALTQTGELLIASASGSQLPSYAFSSPHVIWVVGAQKIVPDLAAASQRLRDYVLPLEDARMKTVGYPGSAINLELIIHRAQHERDEKIILVNEALGF